MATQTTYYNLTKPAGTENVNIGVLNANSDIIDTELHNESVRASANIANIYDATATYTVGEFCTYLGVLYKCTTNTASPAGAFDSTEWEQVNATDEAVSWSSMNVLGVKNLITYPYYSPDSYTSNELTFTVNKDLSVTVNGTAEAQTSFYCTSRVYSVNYKLPSGNYILTGCPSGGSTQSYRIAVGYNVNSSYVSPGNDTGDGLSFTITNDDFYTDGARVQIAIVIANGYTANNLTFYPMIRLASVKDSTYAPYAMTNKELTENKVDWVSNGVLGAKNLNSYPYFYENGQELSQVIWTVNSDGSLIANGTATETASNFICHSRGGNSKNKITIPNGKYILSGCPSGGSGSTYYIGLGRTKNGAFDSVGFDYGDGAVITLNGDDFSDEKVVLQIACVVVRNYTASNLTFKPMIRRIEDTDDTYQPYAMTNKELTDVVNNVPTTAGTYTLQAVRNADNTITYSWV